MYKYLSVCCILFFIGSSEMALSDTSGVGDKKQLKSIEITYEEGVEVNEKDRDALLNKLSQIRPWMINIEKILELLTLLGVDVNLDTREGLLRRFKNWRESVDAGKHAQQVTGGMNWGAQRGYTSTAVSQLRNFPSEALVFYTAIGASMYRKAYTDSLLKTGRTDPKWLETLFHEITSPIGMFSFLMFVMVSGQTNVLYSKLLFNRKMGLPNYINSKLNSLKKKAYIAPNSTKLDVLKYRSTRSASNVLARGGGILGMATGMLASNIVHEIDYITSYNQDYKNCFKLGKQITPQNKILSCDLFWQHLINISHTWKPAIVSLVAASTISHWLVNIGYNTIKSGSQVVKITGSFLKGTVVKTSSRLGLSSVLNYTIEGITWLIVGSKIKAVQMAGGRLGKIIEFGKGLITKIVPSSWLMRFTHLYAFIEIDRLFTSNFLDKIWTQSIYAKPVSDNIETFIRYRDIDHKEPVSTCRVSSHGSKKDCRYHNSVLLIYKTANAFNSWRTYKIQTSMQAYQNWFQYVFSTLNSYNLTYYVYKTFFNNQTSGFSFNQIVYFNLNNKGFAYKIEDNHVQNIFKFSIQKIESYIKDNNILEPSNLNLQVMSNSPSYFINLSFKDRKWSEKIHILLALFKSIDSSLSIREFYGDNWTAFLETERQKIKQQYDDLDKSVLEDSIIIQLAKDNLRKRVLAAGVEFLDIVTQKEQIRCQVRGGIQDFMEPVIGTIRDMLMGGRDTMGSQTCLGERSSLVIGTEYAFLIDLYKIVKSIKPFTQGMNIVSIMNQQLNKIEKQSGLDYHANNIGLVYTPDIIDFILMSSVCGPDLNQGSPFIDQDIIVSNKESILDNIPVFDQSLIGQSYQFYPPRLPHINIDSQTRDNICNSDKLRFSIYNSFYESDNKQYTNLLHLVLDHLEGTEEDFNTWWEETYMTHYFDVFLKLADHEYTKVIENNFIKSLFTQKIKKVEFNKHIDFNYFNFSKSHFVKNQNQNNMKGNTIAPVMNNSDFLILPQGVVANIYFELQYWSDVIVHFAQIKNNINISVLKENLQKFMIPFKFICDDKKVGEKSKNDNFLVKIFNPNNYKEWKEGNKCSVKSYRAWAAKFVQSSELKQLLTQINLNVKISKKNPVDVHSQLIQFSVLRLQRLWEELLIYNSTLENISSNSEMTRALLLK